MLTSQMYESGCPLCGMTKPLPEGVTDVDVPNGAVTICGQCGGMGVIRGGDFVTARTGDFLLLMHTQPQVFLEVALLVMQRHQRLAGLFAPDVEVKEAEGCQP